MWKFIVPLVAFGLLIAMFVKGLDPERDIRELPSPFLGKAAPAFDLPRLRDPGQRVSSADYEGEMALINFWATWCVGCRQEHAFLMELSAEIDIPIYGIDWRDQRDAALRWLSQLGDPYVASGFDADSVAGINWGVYGAPETFLIGADGRVLHKHLGPLDRLTWEADFVPLIEADEGATR